MKFSVRTYTFLSDKRPKILFEGHVFWRQLKALGIDPNEYVMGNEDILYLKWTREHYKGRAKEYNRLNRAKEIHDKAALASASWGTFQIMGFNYGACGFSNVKSYVKLNTLMKLSISKRLGTSFGQLIY
ncbi:MAG: DUF3380 domain-containing protein [Flavobacteriales bacterium]|nr:DUF3380 domain-containing protein [Flavobacteriales bacterium]